MPGYNPDPGVRIQAHPSCKVSAGPPAELAKLTELHPAGVLSPEELEAHKTCVAIQMRQGVAETSSWRLPRTRWECAPPGITVAPPVGLHLPHLHYELL